MTSSQVIPDEVAIGDDQFTLGIGNIAGFVRVRSVTYGDAGPILGDKNATNSPGPLISNHFLIGDNNGLKYFEGT